MWADTQAVKSTIQQVPILSTTTFVGPVPQTVSPLPGVYCLIWPADGIDEAQRFTGPATVGNPSFTLHIVGATADQVQVITGLVKAQFVTGGIFHPPTVTGRTGRAGYWNAPTPIQSDTTVSPVLVYAVVELGWQSVPSI